MRTIATTLFRNARTTDTPGARGWASFLGWVGLRPTACALLICALALGQGPGGGGGGGGRGGGGGGMGEVGGMRGPMNPAERERMMFDMVCDQLDLKKDQKKKLFQAFGGVQAELVAAEAKIFSEALAMLNDGQKKKADTLYSMIPQLTAPARAGR